MKDNLSARLNGFNMNKEVSEYDKNIYTLIRNNISQFIQKSAEIYDKSGSIVLDIAPQVHEGAKKYFTKSRVYTLDIDENSGANYIADLCVTNHFIPSEAFDVIVCTDVLEHTLRPFDAVAEIHRLLKPEGVLLLSTPFDFRIHGPLPDCWRFTEHGLRSLLSDFCDIMIFPLENPDRFLMPYHYTVVAKKKVIT
jgi:SAM-dependent methyltransferase